MKKSPAVQITFLSSVAAMMGGCEHPAVPVHLNALGQCVSEVSGQPVDLQVCYGRNGGYYGGTRYFYRPQGSAPYYSNPSSPGYVQPWSGSAASGTVRGVFGGSAEGHGSGGGAGAGE